MSPELKKRVEDAIREFDYHPSHVARSLKAKRTNMLGIVIPDIANPFFPQVVRGAEEAALAHGYLLVTFNTDDRVEREKQVLSEIRQRRMDGVLLVVVPQTGSPKHIEALRSDGTPVVCLDRLPGTIDTDSVVVDNVKGAQVCVRHLIRRGHRSIAMITGSIHSATAVDRLKGYKAALEEAGLPVDSELILHGDFRSEAGYRHGKELLLRRDRPTAIFVSNAMMTSGLLRALREVGLDCPRDIAIATFDDLPFTAGFRPELTSVVQPAHEIGYRGAELLIKRVRKSLPPGPSVHICLDTELKIRESTSAPPSTVVEAMRPRASGEF